MRFGYSGCAGFLSRGCLEGGGGCDLVGGFGQLGEAN
jgi:hypothetical protein